MRIYKIGDAAKYIGYKPNTLQRWDREGKLKAHRTPTNRRYYTQEQLDSNVPHIINILLSIFLHCKVGQKCYN